MTTIPRVALIGTSLALPLSGCSTTEAERSAAADDGLVCQR